MSDTENYNLDFEYGISQRGERIVIHNGHEFTRKKENMTSTNWRCARWKSNNCKMTLTTCDGRITRISGQHHHLAVPGKAEARQLVEAMKTEARTQQKPVNSHIIASTLQDIDSKTAVQLSMPTRSAINRALNRTKTESCDTPIVDRHFELPAKYESFCLYDSGIEDSERFLIFGDSENLAALKWHKKLWLCDGTFNVCPSQFYQLYSIHIQIGGFYPACVYAVLSNKKEATYRRFLVALQFLTDNIMPEQILLDFEQAALNAFSNAYPQSQIKGCYFHLCQSFNRKISEIGLQRFNERNPEFALNLKMLPALSFLPEEMVTASFDLVIEEWGELSVKHDIDDATTDKFDELAMYFQATYVKGKQIGSQKRPPIFPIHLWNHQIEAAEGLARTTNAVEGWHCGIKSLFQGAHPALNILLDKLKLDSATQKFNMLKASSGSCNKPRKKYRELNEKVQNLQKQFNKDNIIPYLRALAHLSHS